jgi:hypothetical protein
MVPAKRNYHTTSLWPNWMYSNDVMVQLAIETIATTVVMCRTQAKVLGVWVSSRTGLAVACMRQLPTRPSYRNLPSHIVTA